jgi:hypothetical protein
MFAEKRKREADVIRVLEVFFQASTLIYSPPPRKLNAEKRAREYLTPAEVKAMIDTPSV